MNKTATKTKTRAKNAPRKKASTKKATTKKSAATNSAAKGVKASEAQAQEKSVENNQSEDRLLKLRPVMVVNDANSLHAGLVKFIEYDTNITIDASSVEMIDTAILQLLLAFVQQLRDSNKTVTWKEPSSEFCNRASILGLMNEFGINEVPV